MENTRTFNADIPGRIAEFQAVIKQFELKDKLYRILLRGKGLEFESFANYTPDDDASLIDWKASMRANKMLIKQYREERNLKVVFVIDTGENMVFGSSERLKCEYAAEVVAAFAHLIVSTGDRIGLVLFSDKVNDYIRPKAGMKHFHRFISRISDPKIYGGPSNIKCALEFAINYIPRGIDSLIMVSDFLSLDQDSVKEFALVGSKFETVAVMIKDPLDLTLPPISRELVIEDPNTHQQLLVNPNIARQVYEKFAREQEEFVRKQCTRNNTDVLELLTSNRFVPTLAEFLKKRAKEGR